VARNRLIEKGERGYEANSLVLEESKENLPHGIKNKVKRIPQ
jgi:hypothetical protein